MDDVIQRARQGDRDAMAHIVGVFYDTVFCFCARRIGRDAAEDAAQETFLTAQREMKKFEERSSLKTWLLGIAHNHCRSISRKRKLESQAWSLEERSETHESVTIDRALLTAALKQLSDEHRDVVLLHEVEGLTYDEAALVLGVPSGTVKSRLHHAFLNLRKSLRSFDEVTT